MGQITVFGGAERRRRWSNEERLHILTEAFALGAFVAQVTRRHDVSTGVDLYLAPQAGDPQKPVAFWRRW